MEAVACLPKLEALRAYVRDVLCKQEHLDPEQSPFFQAVLTRSGRVCGMTFTVQGPRRVHADAIWAGEENRVLFYDSQGRRFGETRLSEAPDPLELVS